VCDNYTTEAVTLISIYDKYAQAPDFCIKYRIQYAPEAGFYKRKVVCIHAMMAYRGSRCIITMRR
jgi:hypothetical protein